MPDAQDTPAPRQRPNILFLMSDEHRADVTGFGGNAVVRTPVLDELARTGVVFNNAYTPSPICIPSRQCIQAGQLCRTAGVMQYGDDLTPNYMTWPRVLSQHAYQTVCCGKLHHMGPDQMQGWRKRISFDDVHVEPKYMDGVVSEEFVRYRKDGLKWSDAKEMLRAGPGMSPHAVSDEFSVSAAEAYINEYFSSPFYDKESGQQPLCLKVSLLLPHYPYFCSEEKFRYYLNRVPLFGEEQEVFDHPFLSERQVKLGEEATVRDLQRATAAYYGMVETIDEQYGRVQEALRQAGQDLDDWIIIYTSDHGEMLGEHGIWEKQKFFEGSARVPLIIRWPKRFAPRVVEENVNLCDLFATLCDLADLPVPDGLDSRSLVPLLEGDAAVSWDNESISHFGKTNLMIKRDHLKYQYYGEDKPEVLFDLRENPAETVNYIGAPQYELEVAAFRQRRAQLGYGPDAAPYYINAGYRVHAKATEPATAAG